jgi:long-chain acyl-CoA synthetase
MKNVCEFLLQWKDSEKSYLIQGDRTLSYRETVVLTGNGENALRSLGIAIENVGLLADNSIEYILCYWSILFSESTCIPFNPRLTHDELSSEISYCDCNWILCQAKHRDTALALSERNGIGVVEIGDDLSLSLVRSPSSRRTRENSSDIAVMLHTSGTMGSPKKVMLSHGNLIANTQSHLESLELTSQDVVLIALPLFFGYCHSSQFLTHTRLGGTLVLYDAPVFMPRAFCQCVERYGVSTSTAVPTMLYLLDQYPYLAKHDMKSLCYVCFGGATMSLELLDSLIKKLPATGFVQTYGQTECSPRVTALLPPDAVRKLGSVGKPIPGVTVELVTECGAEAAIGEIGEIRVKGKNTTPGYYKNREETEKIRRNDWLYTGDLARQDEEGYIYLTGRKKNMIICSGVNVYPEEIEYVLLRCPLIGEACVAGDEDVALGERIVAYVVPHAGQSVTMEEIHQFLDGQLARYKWPSRLVLTDAIPKTATGKVNRAALRVKK